MSDHTDTASVSIRRARPDDIGRIGELLRQVNLVHHNGRPDIFRLSRKYTDEELTEVINKGEAPIFVAVDARGLVTGYAFVQFQVVSGDNMLMDRKTLYVDDICVDETARGTGTGRSLYEHVKAFAREEGCYNITLRVWGCNPGARSFYESMGMDVQATMMEEILR